MSNETKRDVFEDALRALEEFGEQGSSWEMAYDDLSTRYADALPDDLPVIPEAVSEYIKWGKTFGIPMYMMFSFKFVRRQKFSKFTDEVEDWIISNSDAFAIAWLLGVWHVQETAKS